MFGVLIVDDERYVRLWVRNCIRWEDYGFEIIGEAEDGSEALTKMEELNPRLVISDMEMPDMDGVQLIEKASALYPDTLFLILSGYNTFEYMHSAVRNNAVDYLLKPVNEEDIVPAIDKIKNRLEDEDKKKEALTKSRIITSENLKLKREKFLADLLDGIDLEEISSKTGELGILTDNDSYCALSIRFDEKTTGSNSEEHRRAESLRTSVAGAAEAALKERGLAGCFLYRKNEVAGIVGFSTENACSYQELIGICRKIVCDADKTLGLPLTIGLGSPVNDVADTAASYEEAKRALNLKNKFGENRVLSFLDAPMANSAVEKSKEYIRENFKKDITLADVSSHVHFTPNYLSTLFKAETGYNVSDYITILRIEEVKTLMTDQSLKTYEIGEMVGYREPKYFCRVFKKVMGQSPMQYRKWILKEMH